MSEMSNTRADIDVIKELKIDLKKNMIINLCYSLYILSEVVCGKYRLIHIIKCIFRVSKQSVANLVPTNVQSLDHTVIGNIPKICNQTYQT